MTKTAIAQPDQPDRPLQQPGEVCSSCLAFWLSQKLQPRRMTRVFDRHGQPVLTDEGIPIVVCPYCDGELILKLKK